MKYRINEINEMEFDVISEDGGVVSIYHNDENQVSMYYQDRITEDMDPDEIWETLAEGKAYLKDWPEGTHRDTIILDALDWLVFPTPVEGWSVDDTIWKKFELAW
jgi:hypothetical protein